MAGRVKPQHPGQGAISILDLDTADLSTALNVILHNQLLRTEKPRPSPEDKKAVAKEASAALNKLARVHPNFQRAVRAIVTGVTITDNFDAHLLDELRHCPELRCVTYDSAIANRSKKVQVSWDLSSLTQV